MKRRLNFDRKRRERQGLSVVKGLFLCFFAFLVGCLFIINLHFTSLKASSDNQNSFNMREQLLRSAHPIWVTPQAQPFNQDQKASNTHHLIMVAGHSVTVSGHLQDADVDEKDWYLLDYQVGRGLPEAIVAHIRRGIQEADQDPDSLLIFSGGETRATAGPVTEGASYFRVADAMSLWPTNTLSTVRARTVTEEYATDSFENLLFSICRFREVTGSYPTKITVISFSFKEWRFEKLHARALSWPAHQFQYIGVDPPASTGFDLEVASKGERENAAQPFQSDPYGCHTAILQEKRKSRNPYSRRPPYELTCPELAELLHYCGPNLFPANKLPWH